MTEAHVFDLLPGYALEILDEADLLSVARHLPHCPACRSELETYFQTMDLLAQAAPPRIPPAGLRDKVLQRVTAFNNAVTDAAPVTAVPAPAASVSASDRPDGKAPRPDWRARLRELFAPRLGLALSVLALLLIVFLAFSSLMLWQRVGQLQASLPASDVHFIALRGTSDAPLAQGYLLAFKGDIYGTLTVENAPALEAGRQYQIWLVRDGQRSSGGVFSVNSDGYGTLMITADRPLDTFQSFGITIEPTGGSPGPTGKKVLGSKT